MKLTFSKYAGRDIESLSLKELELVIVHKFYLKSKAKEEELNFILLAYLIKSTLSNFTEIFTETDKKVLTSSERILKKYYHPDTGYRGEITIDNISNLFEKLKLFIPS